MKKIYYFILASAVSVALNSCTNDDIVGGENNGTEKGLSEAIMFGSGFKVYTRAEKLGAEAASLLGNQFIVAGVKGDGTGTGQTDVFKSYTVEWAANTAGTTQSNTSDWEYVGKQHKFTSTGITSQTVKFWDYSQAAYDFCAYSVGQGNTLITTGDASGTNVLATPITYNNTGAAFYTLTGDLAALQKCYITDMETVVKANYNQEVELQFHSLAAKVRMGIYETVPGYSVTNVNFYIDGTTPIKATGTGTDQLNNTSATLIGTNAFYSGGTYTITFPKIGSGNSTDPEYNKAQVAISGTPTTANTQGFGTLNYDTNGKLGTSSYSPSYAGTDPYFMPVLPNTSGNVLEMRVNYTLVADDGSGEVINVHGAKAFIPATYTKWLPNYAYTYIFKISDNTNGWTSTVTDDPAGLFPITFDAIVAESVEGGSQATITTVATPSITTYQKGHDTTKDEYGASTTNPIYVQVMVDGTLKGDLASKGQLYTLSAAKTEAEVLDALSIQESSTTTTITGRNGLILTEATSYSDFTTIPGADGKDIAITAGQAASFEATTDTYAYVYDTGEWDGVAVVFEAGATAPSDWNATNNVYYSDKKCQSPVNSAFTSPTTETTYYKKVSYIYTAEKYTSQPTDFATAGIYYEDPNGLKDVTVAPVATFSAATYYYKKYTVDHKIYGVKVIKVVD